MAKIPKTDREWGQWHLARVEIAKKALEEAEEDLERFQDHCPHKHVKPDPMQEDLRVLVGIARGKCLDCGAEVGKKEAFA